MEAIPKLSMVCFDAKLSPENLDLAAKLRQVIGEKFGEDPGAFAAEIKELETLRANSCIRISETIDGVATLKKYYCQLIFLQNRFRAHLLIVLKVTKKA
jgi:tyrosine-protein phosphatase non-receptor type 23